MKIGQKRSFDYGYRGGKADFALGRIRLLAETQGPGTGMGGVGRELKLPLTPGPAAEANLIQELVV